MSGFLSDCIRDIIAIAGLLLATAQVLIALRHRKNKISYGTSSMWHFQHVESTSLKIVSINAEKTVS
jgi:hypothetical protein